VLFVIFNVFNVIFHVFQVILTCFVSFFNVFYVILKVFYVIFNVFYVIFNVLSAAASVQLHAHLNVVTLQVLNQIQLNKKILNRDLCHC